MTKHDFEARNWVERLGTALETLASKGDSSLSTPKRTVSPCHTINIVHWQIVLSVTAARGPYLPCLKSIFPSTRI